MDRAVAPVTCVRDEINATKKELGAVVPTSRVPQHAVELIGGTIATVSHINTTSSTDLQPLKTFTTVVSTIANVLYRISLE